MKNDPKKALAAKRSSNNALRFLIIAVPGIGDALLATPLIHSIKSSYPDAIIDVFVRLGSEGILASNKEINEIIPFPRRPKLKDYLRLYKRIFRRFDFAISTSPSDRSFINSILAAPIVISLAPRKSVSTLWKYLLADKIVELDYSTHVIDQNLRLTDALGIERSYQVTYSTSESNFDFGKSHQLPKKPYVVVHMMPGSDYKIWPINHWKKTILFLLDSGFEIVLTGGKGANELANCAEIRALCPEAIYDYCGKLSFDQVALLIKDSLAYLGTDTSTTHLASALGVLTFVIFGPSNVVKWGPWPINYASSTPPFTERPGLQKNGNVVVIRANCRCEDFSRTCSKTKGPESLCLVEMNSESVIKALRENLPKI